MSEIDIAGLLNFYWDFKDFPKVNLNNKWKEI